MQAKQFIGTVLEDGHLSLPREMATEVGKQFKVTMLPIDGAGVFEGGEELAKQKGFSDLTEDDLERIIHETRGVR